MSQSDTPNGAPQEQIPASISAAAEAYKVAMEPEPATPVAAMPVPQAQALETTRDVLMSNGTPDGPASPAILPGATIIPSPASQRVGTPSRTTNGNDVTSRAVSQHPDPAPTMPKAAPPHGAPTRQYLNNKVTGPLLEGMKHIAKEQPKDPLRALGEYLLQRSKELE